MGVERGVGFVAGTPTPAPGSQWVMACVIAQHPHAQQRVQQVKDSKEQPGKSCRDRDRPFEHSLGRVGAWPSFP